jgi:transcription initiation factor TFIIE subunit alpha
VAEILGNQDAIHVIHVLNGSGETTDEEIANKTGIRLNFVRKILYKLYDRSLVALRRTRDEKTGWFVFHWKFQPDQLEGFILNQKRRVLEKLQIRLDFEKTHDFYYCGSPKCQPIPFEEAVEFVFRCPSCGSSLMHFNNSDFIKALDTKVEQLRNELSE